MAISKFTLFLGLNDKDSKQQEINTVDAFKIVSNLISTRFGSGTISEATGIYKHDNGEIVTETTMRIELLLAERLEVIELCKDLKRIFNQESIAVQYEVINSELI